MAPQSPGADGRRHPRTPVMRRGVVVHGPSGRSFSCMIVDVSLGGAKLQLIASGLPNADLSLVDAQNGTVHELRIAWRKDPFVGVAFLETTPVP